MPLVGRESVGDVCEDFAWEAHTEAAIRIDQTEGLREAKRVSALRRYRS